MLKQILERLPQGVIIQVLRESGLEVSFANSKAEDDLDDGLMTQEVKAQSMTCLGDDEIGSPSPNDQFGHILKQQIDHMERGCNTDKDAQMITQLVVMPRKMEPIAFTLPFFSSRKPA